MLRFQSFELSSGQRITGDIQNGALHALYLATDELQEGLFERYFDDVSGAGTGGEIVLTELTKPDGTARALRDLSRTEIRGFFADFVGFVLGDGGMLDGLTVRENLLLPFRYRELWPRRSELDFEKMAASLEALTDQPLDRVTLSATPARMDLFQRRYWGMLKTFLTEPRLIVYFSPFSNLGLASQMALRDLIVRARERFPATAHLFMLTHEHEIAELLPGAYINLNRPPDPTTVPPEINNP